MNRRAILMVFALGTILLFARCAKNCECTQYDQDNEPTGEVQKRQIPRDLHLDCSYLETRIDTVWGYKCE